MIQIYDRVKIKATGQTGVVVDIRHTTGDFFTVEGDDRDEAGATFFWTAAWKNWNPWTDGPGIPCARCNGTVLFSCPFLKGNARLGASVRPAMEAGIAYGEQKRILCQSRPGVFHLGKFVKACPEAPKAASMAGISPEDSKQTHAILLGKEDGVLFVMEFMGLRLAQGTLRNSSDKIWYGRVFQQEHSRAPLER